MLSKRSAGIVILLGVVTFYTLGTGFDFFFRLLYALLLILGIGFGWAWLNLRGLEVRLTRAGSRGQAGEYLEGEVQLINRHRLPKSWLEVVEVSDLPDYTTGRGVALVRDQRRTWKTRTYLARRGVYQTGQVEVSSQDPFGLFRLRRRFLQTQAYTVLPAPQPLPDLDPRLAHLPSESRAYRRTNHVTPNFSSVREYAEGDSFRHIHWPYTARMNTLMVKESDEGMSAEAWLVLDLQRSVQAGSDLTDNTEELGVTIAASLAQRMVDLSLPVGLASSGAENHIIRPDSSSAQLGKLMEALAEAQALGRTALERFLYELRPQFSQFNTVTVITASTRPEWVSALASLRRQGVKVAAVLVDPQDFGSADSLEPVLNALLLNQIPVYRVPRGQAINGALRNPVVGADGDAPPDPSAATQASVGVTS
ncbi:MAG: DUF58 domain-containing protein [Dehalococcoidia bacterium]|nr:DUF58 domain-containing protein [Dehalococcoidia bacterium]MSQ16523.1 DUF58 domain-containing protein [Dehalococcoidia bacterium]